MRLISNGGRNRILCPASKIIIVGTQFSNLCSFVQPRILKCSILCFRIIQFLLVSRICLAIISSVKLLVPSRHFRISPSKRSKACCAVLIFFSTEARLDFCRFDSCLIRFSAILEYGVSLICSNIFDTACRTIASTRSARYNACPSQSLPLYSSVPLKAIVL